MIKDLLKRIFAVLSVTLLVIACSEADNELTELTISLDEVTAAAEGTTETLFVESPSKWVAVISEPWLSVSPANGIGTTECTILVDSTLENGSRSAIIEFQSESSGSKIIEVSQLGFGKNITFENEEVEIKSSDKKDKRYFETKVLANVPFNVNITYEGGYGDWLKCEKFNIELDRGARPRPVNLRFEWEMNVEFEKRVAHVNLTPANDEDILDAPAKFTVIQEAAKRIEDTREGDSLALITIFERLDCMGNSWDFSETMRNWENVQLWEEGDTALPAPEAVGRVRAVTFFFFKIEETIPQEIKYLKYLESLDISTNTNTMLLDIELGDDICELNYLKELTLFSYGLISLPDNFVKLGKSLEYLDISANNFKEVPSLLTPNNFPRLKVLKMVASRRKNILELNKAGSESKGIGLHFHTKDNNSLRRLLLWDNLEELHLSNCYIEGPLPDFKPGEDNVRAYNEDDVEKFGGDTIQYLADNEISRILPNMKSLRLNLNFFTGNLPDWLLFHPNLLLWDPRTLIFNQQEKGYDTDGNIVRFDNEPTDFEYYYRAFPKMREKYEFKDEITEE